MSEPLLFTYAVACGFVFSAVLATGYQLLLNRPARFDLVHDLGSKPVAAAFFRMLLIVWAAPYIIMRNAVRGRLIERRPLGWLAASALVAGIWSLCAGILVLHTAIVLG